MRSGFALLVALMLASPALAQTEVPCGYFDSGVLRPESRPDPRPECGGSATALRGGGAQPFGTSANATGTNALTTLFAANNSFAGNVFDIITTEAVVINGFDVNLDPSGALSTIAVYWRPGTADGFHESAAGWTLLGTDDVMPAGLNAATHVDVGGLALDAGSTYGFYIEVQSYPSASIQYTNGGPSDFSDAAMTIRTFYGKGNPAFTGQTFSPRQWNGTVHYTPGAVVPTVPPAVLILMLVLLSATALLVCRRRPRCLML